MHGHTRGVSRDRPDFVRSASERCWIDGDLIRLSRWPVGGIRPGLRGKPVPWLMDLAVLEEAMQEVYGRGFALGDRAPLLQLAADALADGDRGRAAEIADAVAFQPPEFKSRFRDAGLRYLAWGPAHRRGNPRIDIDAWLARTLFERKYDPDQPRVPRGHPDGGQWTDGSDAGNDGDGGEGISGGGEDENPGERPLTDEEYKGILAVRDEIRTVLAETGDFGSLLVQAAHRKGNGRLDELKKLVKPLRAAIAELISTNQLGRLYLLLKLVEVSARELIGLASDAEEWEEIIADKDFRSFEEPEQFKEFYRHKSDPDRDWHHIVEKGANFPEWMKHNTVNMVKIPRAKHWEITQFYSTPNKDWPYYGLSPREWLHGRSWEEHFEHGIDILKRFRGLK
jgi:hypothetical protein